MLDRKFAVHIMRKSGYENAARVVPGLGADFVFGARAGFFVIGAWETLLGELRQ